MTEKANWTPELPSTMASLGEQAAVFDPHPELMTPEYLNNFYLNFGASPYEGTEYDDKERENRILENPIELNTKMRTEITLGQFRAGVESAIEKSGQNLEELKKLQSVVYEASMNQDIKGREVLLMELLESLVPAYLLLRKQGYSHYDLVA